MNHNRILIRAANWVGDAVMCIPAMEQIRARFPRAHIAVLARPWVAGLYDQSLVDEIIPYDAPRGWRGLSQKWAVAKRLRAMRFDCAILFQNAFEAALIAFLARIPSRIGYNRDGRGLLLTDPIKTPAKNEIPRHERYYYLELLRRSGIIGGMPEYGAIRLPGIGRLRSAGAIRLAEIRMPRTIVGVSPGAAYGGAKRWLPERFAESAVELAGAVGGGVAIFGSPDERALCETVAAAVAAREIPVHNFAGETSLAVFIELAAACQVFLTNDSGAMHIASALGVPTVAVFGATDHIGTGPTGPLARVVREPYECSPCLLRECPIDHRCMTGVTSARVSREAMELVKIADTE